MALAETTLSSACGANDRTIVVASAASISVNRAVLIDGELFKVTKAYDGTSTTVPVIRGQDGTAQVAHVSGARVTHGDGSDFGNPGYGTPVSYPNAGRSRDIVSISATSTLELPRPGTDRVVILNGTSVITLTIPVPTKDMDGTLLWIASNGAAAHVLTFTGGLSGAGASYDVVTVNATAPILLGPCMAVNELWQVSCAAPMGGTVTNIIGSIA